jgi:hypothetical protein
MIYKLTKIDNNFFYLSFDNYNSAVSFLDDIDSFMVEETTITKIPSNEVLSSDKAFLLFMMNRFVHLNRLNNISSLESQELLTAFNSIKQLSEVGAVPEVYGSIQALTTPIGRVYTEERKQIDLAKIEAYMAIR